MKRLALVAFASGTSLLPGVALAHPDHASGSFGLAHFLSDPFHLGLTAVAVLLFVAGSRYALHRASQKIDRS